MMTTNISSVCPKCGTIDKSGRISCCGRGGSWFTTCGSDGNTNLEHTWAEGIRACKPWEQLQTANGQRPHTIERVNPFWNGAGTAATAFTVNTSTTMPDSTFTVGPRLNSTVVGTLVTCVVCLLLVLITLTATACFLIRKKTADKKKGLSVELSQPDVDGVRTTSLPPLSPHAIKNDDVVIVSLTPSKSIRPRCLSTDTLVICANKP